MFFRSTNKPWVAIAIIFALILGMIPLFLSSPRSGSSFGQVIDPTTVNKDFPTPPSAEEMAGKEVVKVGVYILSVGNLDTTISRYSVDFFLNFECVTEGCDPSDFDLMLDQPRGALGERPRHVPTHSALQGLPCLLLR